MDDHALIEKFLYKEQGRDGNNISHIEFWIIEHKKIKISPKNKSKKSHKKFTLTVDGYTYEELEKMEENILNSKN